jgi:hypothetical protein
MPMLKQAIRVRRHVLDVRSDAVHKLTLSLRGAGRSLVRWPLTSRPKCQLAQPLRELFPVALGGIFDLLQLFGTKPGGNGFGTQTRSRCIGWRRWRNAGSAHSVPTSKRAGIHAIHASSAASSTESNNHNRISVFTRSSAEDDILFTNVNVEIHKNNLVADSESVDALKSPENFRYPCGSRLGVTCHPSAAAKQRLSKPKPNLTCLGIHLRTITHPFQSAPDYPGTGETLLGAPELEATYSSHFLGSSAAHLQTGRGHHPPRALRGRTASWSVPLGNVCPAISVQLKEPGPISCLSLTSPFPPLPRSPVMTTPLHSCPAQSQ